MTPYKIIVRGSPNWRQFSAATLGVSVASPNWQDEKFASIIEFAAANFETIRIDVTDALYRHAFVAEGMSPEQALSHANSLGAMWLAQNSETIESSPVRPSIVRWAEWYDHEDYTDTLKGFQLAYQTSSVLSEAIHKDISNFYERKHKAPTEEEYDASRRYFIEELAVITLQARELSSLKIYPGDELHCFFVVRNGLVAEAPKGLEREQFAKIKFEARGRSRLLARSMSLDQLDVA